MKHLKRVLSIVLVAVMMFGVIGITGISASAMQSNYTDSEEVNYGTAIDVLSGIGSISGYPDGSFQPQGEVTREEAAKMVCYAILGQEAANRLGTPTADPFDDVKKENWAAKYIAYCKAQGLINGRSERIFDPLGKVTGSELGKILLCALGYGKNNEYVGSQWDVMATTDANRLGLFSTTNATDLGAPATREQTALYIFNAIQKNCVKFSKDTETYDVFTPNQTIAGNIGLTMKTVNDEFMRSGYYWEFGPSYARRQISETVMSAPYMSFNTGLTGSGLASQIANLKVASTVTTYVNGETLAAMTFTSVPTGASAATQLDTYLKTTIAANQLFGNGTIVEIYRNYLGEIDKIVVVVTYLAEVASFSTDSPTTPYIDERAINLNVFALGASKTLKVTVESTGFEELYSTVKKGDFLLVTPNGGTAAVAGTSVTSANALSTYAVSAAIPETVRGKATAISATSIYSLGYIKVDGEQKSIACMATRGITDSNNTASKWDDPIYNGTNPLNFTDFNGTYDFYLDTYGNIIGSKVFIASVTKLDYIYVKDAALFIPGGAGDFTTGGYSAKVSTIDPMTGKAEIKDLYVNPYTQEYYNPATKVWTQITANVATSAFAAGFYSYSVNADGTINLRELTGPSAYNVGAAQITTGTMTATANVANVLNTLALSDGAGPVTVPMFANSNTVLTLAGYGSVSTLTGIANFNGAYVLDANIANATPRYYQALVLYQNNIITDIMLVTGQPLSLAFDPYVYVAGTGETLVVPGYGAQTMTRFYLDGATKSYFDTTSSAVTNMIGTIKLNADGLTGAFTQIPNATTNNGIEVNAVNTGTVMAYDKTYMMIEHATTNAVTVIYYAAGCSIYNVVPYVGFGVADEIQVGDTVSYVMANAGFASVIYITARP